MNNDHKKIEEQLADRIREYKKEFRIIFKQEFLNMQEERLKKGEFFYDGVWVTKEKLPDFYKILLKRKKAVFCELQILVVVLLVVDLIMMLAFKRFILP